MLANTVIMCYYNKTNDILAVAISRPVGLQTKLQGICRMLWMESPSQLVRSQGLA